MGVNSKIKFSYPQRTKFSAVNKFFLSINSLKPHKFLENFPSRTFCSLQKFLAVEKNAYFIYIEPNNQTYGLIIAFQDYVPGSAFPEVKWVGLKWFQKFISGHYFSRLIRNTLVLSGLNLLFGFTAPILIVSAGSVLFCAPKHFHFADPHLCVEKAEEGVLKIYASSFAKSVEIKTGDDTLLLGDKYFDMNPGCRSIRILEGKPENLQVRSVYDIR